MNTQFSSLNYGKKIDPREKSNYYFCWHFSGDKGPHKLLTTQTNEEAFRDL